MTPEEVFALAAQKWANPVESCCPGVTRTEWHVSPAEIAITAWLTPRDGELGDHAPKIVAIVASSVDDDVYAPELPWFARTPSFSSSSSSSTCTARHGVKLLIASLSILNSGPSPAPVSGCKPITRGVVAASTAVGSSDPKASD